MDNFENRFFIERECAKCGKKFLATPDYNYTQNRKCYCSYTCYSHRHDNKPNRMKPVQQYSEDHEYLREIRNAKIAAELVAGKTSEIDKACETGTPYKGYLWKYGTF